MENYNILERAYALLEQLINNNKRLIAKTKKDIEDYDEESELFKDDSLILTVHDEEEQQLRTELLDHRDNVNVLDEFLDCFKDWLAKVNRLINNNYVLTGYNRFENDILTLTGKELSGIDVDNFIANMESIKREYGVKMKKDYRKLINDYNDTVDSLENLIISNTLFLLNTPEQKMMVIQKRLLDLLPFYNEVIDFYEQSKKVAVKKVKELEKEIENRAREKVSARFEEITNNKIELHERYERLLEREKFLSDLKALFDKYNEEEDKDPELFKELCTKLNSIDLINNRELRMLTYVKEEQVDDASIEQEEVKETKVETTEEILDSDYFRRSETKNIICFLGSDDEDVIMEDINKHFDGQTKYNTLGEIVSLFNKLYKKSDTEVSIEETPQTIKYFTPKTVKTLLDTPFKFEYRRYGVHNDDFRIHAIKRHSSLLKELGFGEGDIIFFGSVGINDTKKKSDAYNRLASRAIESLSTSNRPAKLNPSFDYIEHITRRQIPIILLSEEDKSKLNLGSFNGKLKGTDKNKAYENFTYILYDALDDKSKENVKKYLEEYFIKQTTKMFSLIKLSEKRRDNTLD